MKASQSNTTWPGSNSAKIGTMLLFPEAGAPRTLVITLPR
jgi:hypothetical protein